MAGFLLWLDALMGWVVGKSLNAHDHGNRPVSHAEKKSPAENSSNQQMAFDVNEILADLWGSSYALGAYLGAYLKIVFARLAVVAAYWRLFDRRRPNTSPIQTGWGFFL